MTRAADPHGRDVADSPAPPWWQVVPPRPEVASPLSGQAFDPDFLRTTRGYEAAPFTDPVAFFEATVPTGALVDVLTSAVRRARGEKDARRCLFLTGESGNGSTHAMIALWHLFGGTPLAQLPSWVRDIVGTEDLPNVRRIALSGVEATGPSPRPGGSDTAGWLWSSFAGQLEGETVRHSHPRLLDGSGVMSASDLADLLRDHGPTVILLDAWPGWAAQRWHEGSDSGLAQDLSSFAHMMVEALFNVRNALFVVSLSGRRIGTGEGSPHSDAEALTSAPATLGYLVSLMAKVAPWRRHHAEDEYRAIVRRRLFPHLSNDPPDDIGAAIATTAQDHLVLETGPACYPFHPAVIWRLSTSWPRLDGFASLRGALQFTSAALHDLANAGDPHPLILPGTLPLTGPRLDRVLARVLPRSTFECVTALIHDSAAVPPTDRTPGLGLPLPVRLARAIAFASAPTVDHPPNSIDGPGLWRECALPSDDPHDFEGAVNALLAGTTHARRRGPWYVIDPRH